MKFFLKCGDTAEVCDKRQYDEASYWDTLKLRIHILLCKCCREYFTNNNRLTQTLKTADPKMLPKKKKEMMKAKILQRKQLNPNP